MHRYLVRLDNSYPNKYGPRNTIQLLIELRKEADEFRSVVKNLRITENAIEFDLYVLDDVSKSKSLEALGRKFGVVLTVKDLETEPLLQSKESIIEAGIKLFNEERFWECHETVEQLWRREQKGEEKEVQQGFILAASALVHFQKNEDTVCLGMIPRTIAKLDKWQSPKYLELDVDKLKQNLEEIIISGKVAPFKI